MCPNYRNISKLIATTSMMIILVLSLSNLNLINTRIAYAVDMMDSPSIFPFKTGVSTSSTGNTLDKFGIKEIYLSTNVWRRTMVYEYAESN